MKRQSIRRAILLISFLLFPVTINYFSPYLIIDGSSQGIITGSFIAFTLMFLSSLFLCRAWCGWGCPANGLQQSCSMAVDKKTRGGKVNWAKYFIWVPWIGIIAFAAISAGGYNSVKPLYMTENGISVAEPANYTIYFIVVETIVALSFTAGRRAFCHYGCWMAPFMIVGRKIRNFIKWPSLGLTANKDKCINCKTCSKNCPMSLDVNGMVQKESMENSECILCGTCVDGCPKDAIKYAFLHG